MHQSKYLWPATKMRCIALKSAPALAGLHQTGLIVRYLRQTLVTKEAVMSYRIALLTFVGVFMTSVSAADDPAGSGHENIVRSYVEAFNAHNVGTMLKMVSDDVQWLTIDGDKIVTETSNKEELRQAMEGYFESCSTCKSALEQVFSTGNRVSALEVASFETKRGLQTQQSLSIYEFSGNLIKRVYYFSVEN